MFDVVVIGAGPAGSITAYHCAKAGLKTALIEKHKLPRDKPCAGGLLQKGIKHLPFRIPERIIEQHIRGYVFHSPGSRTIYFRSPEAIEVTVKRKKFDHFLTQQAEQAGCNVYTKNRLEKAGIRGDHVACQVAGKARGSRVFKTRLLVGANGVTSTVAKTTGIRRRRAEHPLSLCLTANIDVGEKEFERHLHPDMSEFYFSDIPYGYGWLFPHRESISVGVGGRLGEVKIDQAFNQHYNRIITEKKLRPKTGFRKQAHMVPVGGVGREIVTDRVILVGDAAGFADPLTGEGLSSAILSGKIAAQTCIGALEKDCSKRFLERRYSNSCYNTFGKDLEAAYNSTPHIFNHLDLFFDFLQTSKSDSWIKLAKGELSHEEWQQEIILSLPSILLRRVLRWVTRNLRTPSLATS